MFERFYYVLTRKIAVELRSHRRAVSVPQELEYFFDSFVKEASIFVPLIGVLRAEER